MMFFETWTCSVGSVVEYWTSDPEVQGFNTQKPRRLCSVMGCRPLYQTDIPHFFFYLNVRRTNGAMQGNAMHTCPLPIRFN